MATESNKKKPATLPITIPNSIGRDHEGIEEFLNCRLDEMATFLTKPGARAVDIKMTFIRPPKPAPKPKPKPPKD